MIQYHLKGTVDELSLRISDARGKTIRELTAPESRREPGIRTLCWDMRYEPIETPQSAAGPGRSCRRRARWWIPRRDSRSSNTPRRGRIPAGRCVPGRVASGANAGPYVTPGTYNVALLVNGTTVDTKPIHIVMDPAVDLTGVERMAYDDMLLSLHELQRRGTAMAGVLDGVYTQVVEISGSIGDNGGRSRQREGGLHIVPRSLR